MKPLAAVVGPTGAGKSDVAMLVAARCDAEIVSVDSMQVYRRMDIGTAKPTPVEQGRIRHHMIDVVEPEDEYSVAEFQVAAREVIAQSDNPMIIVGGSGLHFRAIVDPLDFAPTDRTVRAAIEALSPAEARRELLELDGAAAEHVDLANPRRVVRALEVARLTGAVPSERAASPRAEAVRSYRPQFPLVVVGVDAGAGLRDRVAVRFDSMLRAGLADEVGSVMQTWGVTASQAVGYREMARVVKGEWTQERGRQRAIDATMGLAKRQRTYFRRDPRVSWLEWSDDLAASADAALKQFEEAGWTS